MKIFALPVAALAAALIATPAAAQADSAAAHETPSIHRLPDAEVEAIQAEAQKRYEGMEEPDRRIHGEFGVAIGTGGYRSAYGTALIPLGRDAGAVVSFETSRDAYRYDRRRYRERR